MLRKVMTQYVRPSMQAAYAESNDQMLESKVQETAQLMKTPLARFFRIENESGAYVGYFIVAGTTLLTSFVRPHFDTPQEELSALFSEARDPRFASSLGQNNFVTLNLL